MAPLLFTLAGELVAERDPLWEAVLASPLAHEAHDALSNEEHAALNEGMADIRGGRVVSRDHILSLLARMQHEQGE